jgi:hypothetical protein
MTFFDKYSYKQKNYALALLAVLLVAVSYKRAFSTTIETRQYRDELEEKVLMAQTASVDIRLCKAQINNLNRLLGKENITIEKVQQGFLNFFARYSERIAVYQIDEVLTYQHPDFSINTHRIVLRGDYLNTLKFIYRFEQDFDLARLINISFEYKKYMADSHEELYTTILIQNYLRG